MLEDSAEKRPTHTRATICNGHRERWTRIIAVIMHAMPWLCKLCLKHPIHLHNLLSTYPYLILPYTCAIPIEAPLRTLPINARVNLPQQYYPRDPALSFTM